jgi:hypothetical protein
MFDEPYDVAVKIPVKVMAQIFQFPKNYKLNRVEGGNEHFILHIQVPHARGENPATGEMLAVRNVHDHVAAVTESKIKTVPS